MESSATPSAEGASNTITPNAPPSPQRQQHQQQQRPRSMAIPITSLKDDNHHNNSRTNYPHTNNNNNTNTNSGRGGDAAVKDNNNNNNNNKSIPPLSSTPPASHNLPGGDFSSMMMTRTAAAAAARPPISPLQSRPPHGGFMMMPLVLESASAPTCISSPSPTSSQPSPVAARPRSFKDRQLVGGGGGNERTTATEVRGRRYNRAHDAQPPQQQQQQQQQQSQSSHSRAAGVNNDSISIHSTTNGSSARTAASGALEPLPSASASPQPPPLSSPPSDVGPITFGAGAGPSRPFSFKEAQQSQSRRATGSGGGGGSSVPAALQHLGGIDGLSHTARPSGARGPPLAAVTSVREVASSPNSNHNTNTNTSHHTASSGCSSRREPPLMPRRAWSNSDFSGPASRSSSLSVSHPSASHQQQQQHQQQYSPLGQSSLTSRPLQDSPGRRPPPPTQQQQQQQPQPSAVRGRRLPPVSLESSPPSASLPRRSPSDIAMTPPTATTTTTTTMTTATSTESFPTSMRDALGIPAVAAVRPGETVLVAAERSTPAAELASRTETAVQSSTFTRSSTSRPDADDDDDDDLLAHTNNGVPIHVFEAGEHSPLRMSMATPMASTLFNSDVDVSGSGNKRHQQQQQQVVTPPVAGSEGFVTSFHRRSFSEPPPESSDSQLSRTAKMQNNNQQHHHQQQSSSASPDHHRRVSTLQSSDLQSQSIATSANKTTRVSSAATNYPSNTKKQQQQVTAAASVASGACDKSSSRIGPTSRRDRSKMLRRDSPNHISPSLNSTRILSQQQQQQQQQPPPPSKRRSAPEDPLATDPLLPPGSSELTGGSVLADFQALLHSSSGLDLASATSPTSVPAMVTTSSRQQSISNSNRRSQTSQDSDILGNTQAQLGDTQGNLSFTMNSLAATGVNKRTSAFSSLQYSMKRRQKKKAEMAARRKRENQSRDNSMSERPPTQASLHPGLSVMFDDMSIKEDNGTSMGAGDDERAALLAAMESENPTRSVGLWETAEHIFLPKYETLEGGVTPQEAVMRDLKAAAAAASSSEGSPAQSPKKVDASGAPVARKQHQQGVASGSVSSSSPMRKSSSTGITNGPTCTPIHDSPTAAGDSASSPTKEGNQRLSSSPTGGGGGTRSTTLLSPEAFYRANRPPRQANPDVYSLGTVADTYYREPDQEDALADSKVAARLLFDADYGVMLLAPTDEVDRYIRRNSGSMPKVNGNDEDDDACGADSEEDDGGCECDEQFISKDCRGMDYSKYHTHQLYDHCSKCKRRPASFLCLHCLTAVCPSHVQQHHRQNPSQCTLFVNLLDIMTSFDRIFWCEKCQRFTWKYTEIYDPMVDQLAYTRGTYVREAVRDVHCVGWEVQLRDDTKTAACAASAAAAATGNPLMLGSSPTTQSSSPIMIGGGGPTRRVSIASPLMTAQGCSSSPLIQHASGGGVSGLELSDDQFVPVGEALSKLTAVGASVQGWRSTQEDAEVAFLVDIPAPKAEPISKKVKPPTNSANSAGPLFPRRHGSLRANDVAEMRDAASASAAAAGTDDDNNNNAGEKGDEVETIPMAVFCVFDGHGGDAVAKLAAGHFETHLRQAIADVRTDDVRARALLYHVTNESCSPRVPAISLAAESMTNALSPMGSLEGVLPARASAGGGAGGASAPLLVPVMPSPLTLAAISSTSPKRMGLLAGESCGGEDLQVVPITPASLAQHIAGASLRNNNHNNNTLLQSATAAPMDVSPKAPSPRHQTTTTTNNNSATNRLQTWEEDPAMSDSTTRRDSITYPSVGALVSVPEMEMLRSYFTSIMEDALLSLDDYLRHTDEGERGDYNCVGCTACVVGITSNFILCANVGDSGACLYTPDGMEPISVKHRLSDETELKRIESAGYSVTKNRIEGLLAVPRALGDFDFKQCGGRGAREQAVTALPEVTIRAVPSTTSSERWGIILACDGVWDTATLRQVHYALINSQNDLDVAASATEAVLRAKELMHHQMRGPSKFLSDTPTAAGHALGHPGGMKVSPLTDVGIAATAGGGKSTSNSKNNNPNEDSLQDLMNASYVDDLGGDDYAMGGIDARLLTAAAGIFAQCVAPADNEEGIGLDNCSVVIIEPCL